MVMTWRQFKQAVDAELAKRGVSEDTGIWYFDFAFPSGVGGSGMDEITLGVDKHSGIHGHN